MALAAGVMADTGATGANAEVVLATGEGNVCWIAGIVVELVGNAAGVENTSTAEARAAKVDCEVSGAVTMADSAAIGSSPGAPYVLTTALLRASRRPRTVPILRWLVGGACCT
jgi:hypothetical protein